jgi:hypothetical protein
MVKLLAPTINTYQASQLTIYNPAENEGLVEKWGLYNIANETVEYIDYTENPQTIQCNGGEWY